MISRRLARDCCSERDFFRVSPLGERTRAYFGGRIGIARTSRTTDQEDDSNSDSRIDFYIGPSLGAEYALSDHFALGLEGGIYSITLGEFDEPEGVDISRSILQTRGLVFFRAYF